MLNRLGSKGLCRPPNSFSELPEDVARLIFEFIVLQDGCRPRCALVSKQVQLWVEPIIYRDVTVDLKRGYFHRTVTAPVSTKPPNFFATHVKSLFFRVYDLNADHDVAQIVQRCDPVRSLIIWAYIHAGELQGIQEALRSTSLSLTQISFFQFFLTPDVPRKRTFSHRIFSQVTHLDVTCARSEGEWDWPSLKKLDKLTHLSVDAYIEDRKPEEITRDILRHAPRNLRVLVLSLTTNHLSASFLRSLRALVRGDVDSRVVIVYLGTRPVEAPDANFEMSFDDLLTEWSYPSMGSKLWTLAERVVETRQSELAEASSSSAS